MRTDLAQLALSSLVEEYGGVQRFESQSNLNWTELHLAPASSPQEPEAKRVCAGREGESRMGQGCLLFQAG